MLLAELKLPRFDIPERVRKAALRPLIETYKGGAPGGATWISCCYATPHVDKGKGWDHMVFLTVSVVSHHMAGDALSQHPLAHVPAGTLFVVDPLTAHWLFDEDSWERKAARSWVGLQWEVERQHAVELARSLVAQFKGRWLPMLDPRYQDWRTPRATTSRPE